MRRMQQEDWVMGVVGRSEMSYLSFGPEPQTVGERNVRQFERCGVCRIRELLYRSYVIH